MTFKVGGVTHSFQGIKHAEVEALSEKEFKHLQGVGHFLQITLSSKVEPPLHPPDLAHFLADFSLLFEPPTHMPPKQEHDHCILLQPNAEPVSIRPYCYPHYQKIVIKKMVKELLQSGLIKPSHISFSSQRTLAIRINKTQP